MLLKATFQRSFWGWFRATSTATKRGLASWTACYNFMSTKNMPLFQECIIYSPPFGWPDPFHSPPKRCNSASQKIGSVGQVFRKPSLIADASTTICTRPNSRAAPLCPNLDGNLCPTLTAHWEPLYFWELAETRVQASNPYLTWVLGWELTCPPQKEWEGNRK